MGIMLTLPACKDFDYTGSVGGPGDVSKRLTTQALVTRCGLMRSTPKMDSSRHKAAGRTN